MPIITLLVALAISAVAAYFSVFGLVALFAATAIPVAIMGTILEIGKIVAATWLHRHWKESPFLLKSYLVLAVAVLMLITSIGIYGFLSKGHLEQQAPVATMESQIQRNQLTIDNYTAEIARLRTESSGASTSNDSEDARKAGIQAKIDEANLRLAPIDATIQQKKGQIGRLEQRIKVLDGIVENYNRVGSVTKGKTALAEQEEERKQIATDIEAIDTEVVDLETQKIAVNQEISKLKQEMFTPTEATVDTSARGKIETEIKRLETEISTIEDTNLDLKLQVTEVSAKLGPILYVADLLNISDPEKAVQALIVLIMFAFDPIAIALIIAAQWSFIRIKPKKPITSDTTEPSEPIIKYEQDPNLLKQLDETHLELIHAQTELVHTKNLLESQIATQKSDLDLLIVENNKLEAALGSAKQVEPKLVEEIRLNQQEVDSLRLRIKADEDLLIQKEAEISELIGSGDYKFVTARLRTDPGLTKGLKDLMEKADAADTQVDLNEGVPVKSEGARNMVKQIANPDEPSAWITPPSNDT